MSRDKDSSYYDAGGIETLDIIKAKLTPEQYSGFLLGNALKYQCRYNWKHAGRGKLRDAIKASNYLKWLSELPPVESKPQEVAEISDYVLGNAVKAAHHAEQLLDRGERAEHLLHSGLAMAAHALGELFAELEQVGYFVPVAEGA